MEYLLFFNVDLVRLNVFYIYLKVYLKIKCCHDILANGRAC